MFTPLSDKRAIDAGPAPAIAPGMAIASQVQEVDEFDDAAYEPPPVISGVPTAGLTPAAVELMGILQKRASSRAFSERPLEAELLTQLLWAAFGINRPATLQRTAPSARNWQEISIYVVKEDGMYLFDAQTLGLSQLSTEDLRAATGWQEYVPSAPVNLVYVADFASMDSMEPAARDGHRFYAALDTGFISQNVYLFCAAQGLSTVVRGWVDRPALAKTMALGPTQRIMVAQSIGYPADVIL